MGKISCMYRRSTGRPARASAATEAFSIMTNSIRFTKCSTSFVYRVRCSGAFDWKSKYRTCGARGVTKRIGGRRRAQMLRNVARQSGGHYPAVGCMYRAWQIVSCDHSRILAASLARIVVRDIIIMSLRGCGSSAIPDARPETLAVCRSHCKAAIQGEQPADCRECGSHALIELHDQRVSSSGADPQTRRVMRLSRPARATRSRKGSAQQR